MKKGDKVFVYGTLKRGKGANGMMMGKAEFKGTTRISGTLHNLGWFPGVKLVAEGDPVPFVSEGPTVTGELYEITDDSLAERLDGYEGYPYLYGRQEVMTESGEKTWVYVYNDTPSESSLIPLGVWE